MATTSHIQNIGTAKAATIDSKATVVLNNVPVTIPANEMNGQIHVVMGALTMSLPLAVVGYSAIFFVSTASVIIIDLDQSSDIIILSGIAQAAGESIISNGAIYAMVQIICITAGYYIAIPIQGIWTNGG